MSGLTLRLLYVLPAPLDLETFWPVITEPLG